MRIIHIVVIIAGIFIGLSQVSAQFYVIDSSTSIAGYNSWGNNNWYKYRWYRYGECMLEKDHSRGLANPTYLNAIMNYSQSGQTCIVDVYINTSSMLDPGDSWRFYNSGGGWSNWHTRSGGHFVGTYETPAAPTHGLVSWNITSWILSHPSNNYYIVFDQEDYSSDVVVRQAWIGPQGIMDILENTPEHNNYSSINIINSPNPFSSSTSIRYYLSNKGDVSIKVFDINGNRIRSLSNIKHQSIGENIFTWDGSNDRGIKVPNGTYFYVIETSNLSMQGKMVLQNERKY